jgi:hypothetical protein
MVREDGDRPGATRDHADRVLPSGEQSARVVRVWRQLRPTEAEVTAAHVRFLERRRRDERPRFAPRSLVLALVLTAAATAAAGVHVARTRALAARDSGGAPVRNEPASPARARRSASPLPDAPPAALPSADIAEPELPPARLPLPSDETSAPAAAPEVTTAVAPRAAGPSAPPVEASRAPTGTLVAPAVGPPRAATPVASESPAAAVPSPTMLWAAAAAALRAGDYAAAERAFDELARTGDPRARDESRLARAQIWLAQGQAARATPELTALAESGATSFVRARAREALRTSR